MSAALVVFLGLSLSGAGTETLQLMELIQKSQQQIEELKKILDTSNFNSQQLSRSLSLSEEIVREVNAGLAPLKDTAEYQAAILELQSKDDFANAHSLSEQSRQNMKLPSDEETKNEKSYRDFRELQEKIVQSNEAQRKNLSEWKTALTNAPAGAVPKNIAQATGEIWENNLQLSMQLTVALDELRSIREELRRQRKEAEAESSDEKSSVKDTLSRVFGFGGGHP